MNGGYDGADVRSRGLIGRVALPRFFSNADTNLRLAKLYDPANAKRLLIVITLAMVRNQVLPVDFHRANPSSPTMLYLIQPYKTLMEGTSYAIIWCKDTRSVRQVASC